MALRQIGEAVSRFPNCLCPFDLCAHPSFEMKVECVRLESDWTNSWKGRTNHDGGLCLYGGGSKAGDCRRGEGSHA